MRRLPVRSSDPLVGWLEEERRLRALGDAAFAQLLGVSGPQWSNLRAGRRALTRPLVERLARQIPGAAEAYRDRCLRARPGGRLRLCD